MVQGAVSEDCLYLNVWTPAASARERLPVIVWIHGGALMNGSSSVADYDGAAFARDGVVFVSINYRLAAEGFLYLGDGVVNLGLLDQLAALRWVQDNIAFFGGDPARVTVAGESAGAMSVTTLLSMPLASGLFAQAIAESGAGAHTLAPAEGLMVGRYLAEALGVPADRESIKAVPLDKLVQAASDLAVHAGAGKEIAGRVISKSRRNFFRAVDCLHVDLGRLVPRCVIIQRFSCTVRLGKIPFPSGMRQRPARTNMWPVPARTGAPSK